MQAIFYSILIVISAVFGNITEFAQNESEVNPSIIIVDSPQRYEAVESPLTIEGKARGFWFFEGDAPIEIRLQESGDIIAQSYISAQGEWMTEEYVPFKGEIEFTASEAQQIVLVLKKDNPSGLEQYDESVEIPLYVK